jgi:1-acyl-sn-glycerol-3-phosphate acyltransferase
MRAGVPIVPIAVVGSEESMPILFNVQWAARLLGTPYFPVTANQVIYGPLLGLVAPLPAKFTLRVLDPVHLDVQPDQPRYSKSRVMEQAESVRQQIQETLFDMLKQRKSVWAG